MVRTLIALALCASVAYGQTARIRTTDGWKKFGGLTWDNDSVYVAGGPGGATDSTVFATVNRTLDSLGDHQTQFSAAINAKAATSHTHYGLGLDSVWTIVVRSADTSHTNPAGAASWVNLGQLEFNMVSSGFYEFEAYFLITRQAAAGGITLGLNITGSPTRVAAWGKGENSTTVGTDFFREEPLTTATDSLQLWGTTVTTGEQAMIRGFVQNQAAVNGFKFRFHSELTGSNAVTIKQGSYLRYRRLY